MKQNKYIMKEFEEILIKNNYKKFYYNNKKKYILIKKYTFLPWVSLVIFMKKIKKYYLQYY